MVGDEQCHIEQCMSNFVHIINAGQTIVAPDVLKLVNQVEKEKQRQKASSYQPNRGEYLAVDESTNSVHGVAPVDR